MTTPELHPSIIALVSLAANIASNHPKQGLCQLERLRGMGIAEEQIAMVIDIARHIRNEAGAALDCNFDEKSALTVTNNAPAPESAPKAACCTPTAKGNACC